MCCVLAAGLGALGAYLAARRGVGGIIRAVDTGNEKQAGEYIHDTAGTVELVQAQGHATARRLDEVHTAVLEVREYAAQTRERLVLVHDLVLDVRQEARDAMASHLEEVQSPAPRSET